MNIKVFAILFSALTIFGCTQTAAQKVQHVNPQEFQNLMKTAPDKVILDVRTPGEFASGHIPGAININISDAGFAEAVSALDTSKPVFVYCLAGGRSASATDIMSGMGFQNIIDLSSGFMQWSSQGFPVETGTSVAPKSSGMTDAEFANITAGDTLLLVDFSAKWCTPCVKIKKFLPELEESFKGKINILQVDYDDNSALIKSQNISTVPYLRLYRKGAVVWDHPGAVEKADVAAAIEQALK